MTLWRNWPQTVQLAKAFADAGADARFVGGCVRDALLGRPVQDVDLATKLAPDAVMALLAEAGIKAVPTGLAHGTVTAVLADKSFEITTLRRDKNTDGRHAEVEFTGDWQEDAARRDFTMNALYQSFTGELFDYFDGAEDAKAGRVRFIGDAQARIKEDYLRILRFFRFHAHVGKGVPDAQALAACEKNAPGIDALSGERIQQELFKLLTAESHDAVLTLMNARGILPHALGFAVTDCTIFSNLKTVEKSAGLRLGPAVRAICFALTSGLDPFKAAYALGERLRLSNRQSKQMRVALETQEKLNPGLDDAAQKRLLRRLGKEDFTVSVAIKSAADMAGAPNYLAMLKLAASWRPPTFPVNGGDLKRLGMKEGKEMGETLRRLENQWEKSGYVLNKQELLAKMKE